MVGYLPFPDRSRLNPDCVEIARGIFEFPNWPMSPDYMDNQTILAGMQQVRCRYCEAPLDFASKHADDCQWLAEQAERMRNVPMEERLEKYRSGLNAVKNPVELA